MASSFPSTRTRRQRLREAVQAGMHGKDWYQGARREIPTERIMIYHGSPGLEGAWGGKTYGHEREYILKPGVAPKNPRRRRRRRR